VNAALEQACRDAEALLLARPGDVTLGKLRAGVHAARAAGCGIHEERIGREPAADLTGDAPSLLGAHDRSV
jgi:hypothetical protein